MATIKLTPNALEKMKNKSGPFTLYLFCRGG